MKSTLSHCTHLTGHSREVTDMQWSKDSRFLVSCSMDQTAILWKIDTENPQKCNKIQTFDNISRISV